MKTIFIKTSAVLAALSMLAGCTEKEGPMKWVDLRYDVPQDTYIVDAEGVGTVTIRVKSTDPWEVFGSGMEDWYVITPDKGGPDRIYEVVIRCLENTGLDDRAETINIKSDYWTGKQFQLIQKGTAYLDYEQPSVLPQTGAPVSFGIRSNQEWRAEVTSGSEWMEVDGTVGGEGDGSITVSASVNSGEMRYGRITLYDRNGDPVREVQVTQDGVLLSPSAPDNGLWFVLYEESQQLRIPVEANARWSVAKQNPEDELWYDFEGPVSFEGSGEIVVNVSEYEKGGPAYVRTGTLVLSSEAEAGVTPVVKTVRFKQASPDENRTRIYPGAVLDAEGLTSGDGQTAGRYTFYLAPFDASTSISLYFIWQKDDVAFAELRFWLNTSYAPMKTELSCMPYCNDVNKWQSSLLVPFDSSKPVKIAIDVQESEPDAAGRTWIRSEWWLNDSMIAEAVSDGIVDRDGGTDTWKVPYSDVSAGGLFKIFASAGSGTLDKWEYTSPLEWGE